MLNKAKLFDASASRLYSHISTPVGLNHEIPFFIVLAILSACLGSLYIFVHREYCAMKKRYSHMWFFNAWVYSLFIALAISSA